jgi:alanyl-tRNA synthetase
VAGRIEALQEELKQVQAQLKKGAASDLAGAGDKLLAEAPEAGGAKVIVGEVPAAPVEQIRAQADRLRQKARSAVIVLGWVEDGKVGLLGSVTEDLTGKVEAGKLIGEVAKVVGGRGGGRKDMAMAGGSEPGKLGEALALARKVAGEKLGA